MEVEELGLHQHLVWAGDEELPGGGRDQSPLAGEDHGRHCHGRVVRVQYDAQHAAGVHGEHHRGGDSHHPRQVRAGVGGQPVGGQDDAPQAERAHGYKHHGTELLQQGNRDTVYESNYTTILQACRYKGCPYRTGDHMPGASFDAQQGLLKAHYNEEHPAPTVIMVEGGLDKESWETFKLWYGCHADANVPGHFPAENVLGYLSAHQSDVGDLLWSRIGASVKNLGTPPSSLKKPIQGGQKPEWAVSPGRVCNTVLEDEIQHGSFF